MLKYVTASIEQISEKLGLSDAQTVAYCVKLTCRAHGISTDIAELQERGKRLENILRKAARRRVQHERAMISRRVDELMQQIKEQGLVDKLDAVDREKLEQRRMSQDTSSDSQDNNHDAQSPTKPRRSVEHDSIDYASPDSLESFR